MTPDGFLPDVGPAISRLAMVVHESLFRTTEEAVGQKEAYANLIRGLPESLELMILIDADQKEDVTAWLAAIVPERQPHLVIAPGNDITNSGAWIRDEFLCRYTGGTATHVELRSFKSGNFGKYLTTANQANFEKGTVALDGGDCLVTRERWIVGVQAVNSTILAFNEQIDFDTARSKIAALDPRPLTLAGFRIADLKFKLLWAKTEMQRAFATPAIQAESATTPPPPTSFIATAAKILSQLLNQSDLIQGWAHIDLVVSVTGIKKDGQEVLLVSSVVPTPDGTDDYARLEGDKLDALAIHLASEGFHVIRTPTPYFKKWLFHYNNAIVQNEPNIVWLPHFSDAKNTFASDDENVEIWKGLGFEVIPIPGWRPFVDKAGAIRCATKPLARIDQWK